MKYILIFFTVTFLCIFTKTIDAQEKPISLINHTSNANFIFLRVKNVGELKKATSDHPLIKLIATENNGKFIDRLIVLYWYLHYKSNSKDEKESINLIL